MPRVRLAVQYTLAFALALSTIHADQPIAMKARAPELASGQWINTPAGERITLATRRGKVTVVHFWTFGCINCKHNLAAYNNWHSQFAPRGVEVIGIHTPELETERVRANIERAVKQFGIEYPVLIDNDHENWRRWNQEFWPAVYVVDKRGRIRYRWEGELNYQNSGGEGKISTIIEKLLAEPE
ncbi:MAG: cytochrome c-like DipZ protein thioredoxin [Bryobacterales bacterium]|jgi:peroxiredoxin|nr:cytochrome c-like DipZ protein thioredoxin [Bryobacterales bacterium]